jgi:hypothetical protein
MMVVVTPSPPVRGRDGRVLYIRICSNDSTLFGLSYHKSLILRSFFSTKNFSQKITLFKRYFIDKASEIC